MDCYLATIYFLHLFNHSIPEHTSALLYFLVWLVLVSLVGRNLHGRLWFSWKRGLLHVPGGTDRGRGHGAGGTLDRKRRRFQDVIDFLIQLLMEGIGIEGFQTFGRFQSDPHVIIVASRSIDAIRIDHYLARRDGFDAIDRGQSLGSFAESSNL